MKVAILSRAAHPFHAPGGMERAVFHLARHLAALGTEVVLVTRQPERPGAFPGEVIAVPYATSPGGRHGAVLDRTLHYPGFARRVGDAVAGLVRAGRVDLVHANGLTALGYGRLRRTDAALRAPLVMNPHGMEEHKAGGLKRLALLRLAALSREAARLADRVIATDQALRAEAARLLRVPQDKVVVLPNAVDPAEIDALTPNRPRAALRAAVPSLKEADPLLLSVGRLESYKGFEDTLTALRGLASRGALAADWAWLVVGEGPRRSALAARVRAFGLAGRIHLAGRLEEASLHAAYAAADLLVHATRYEGSSLVVLEAMAHGLPVVAARAGGIPDRVIDGETGRLVAPGDPAALARAIEDALGEEGRRRSWGERGRALVLDRFAWPAVARQALALYRSLLAEAASR